MSKKMTPAMRLWRDENMGAIREGVKAVKEGRTMPADTFFEWMQAKYVRDIWEARIARLQKRVEEAEADFAELEQIGNEHYSNQIAVLETERNALQARVEEAEIKLGFFESAGFPTPQDILEKIDGYKALAERRKEVLDDWPNDGHSSQCSFLRAVGTKAIYPKCDCGFEAREEARAAIEEEGKRPVRPPRPDA